MDNIIIKSTSGADLFSHNIAGNTPRKTLEKAVDDKISLFSADFTQLRFDFSNLEHLALYDAGGIIASSQKEHGIHADFVHARIEGGTFRNCIFTCANFIGAKASDASFINSDLSYAQFIGADLERADLDRCNIIGTDFRYCNLQYAKFTPSKMVNAIITGALFSDEMAAEIEIEKEKLYVL